MRWQGEGRGEERGGERWGGMLADCCGDTRSLLRFCRRAGVRFCCLRMCPLNAEVRDTDGWLRF